MTALGFCLSLYGLHVLTRDVDMIHANKQTNKRLILLGQTFYVMSYLFHVHKKQFSHEKTDKQVSSGKVIVKELLCTSDPCQCM